MVLALTLADSGKLYMKYYITIYTISLAYDSYCSCPVCLIEGKSVKYKRQRLGEATKFAFCYDVGHPPKPRTKEVMKTCMERCAAEGGTCRDPATNYGVKEIPVLSQLEDKNLTDLLAIDAMHLLYEGVYKRTFLLTYDVGGSMKGHFSLKTQFDVERVQEAFQQQTRLTETKPLRQFLATQSANLWRNQLVIWFPLFIENLGPDREVCDVFKCLSMIGRWYLFDLEDHQTVCDQLEGNVFLDMKKIVIEFQELYVSVYKEANATYNLHLMTHLPQVYARHGPLYNTNAFGAESVYGYISRHASFTSRNITLTWMKNGILRPSNKHSRCRAPPLSWAIRTEAEAASRRDDSILWIKGFFFFRVQKVLPGQKYLCREMLCEDIFDRIEELHRPFFWSQFGVRRWCNEMQSRDPCTLQAWQIKGKGVIVSRQDGEKWIVAVPSRVIKGEN